MFNKNTVQDHKQHLMTFADALRCYLYEKYHDSLIRKTFKGKVHPEPGRNYECINAPADGEIGDGHFRYRNDTSKMYKAISPELQMASERKLQEVENVRDQFRTNCRLYQRINSSQ